MDFNDTPEEAAFRAEARAWLEANTELLEPGEIAAGGIGERTSSKAVKAAQVWQKKRRTRAGPASHGPGNTAAAPQRPCRM